MKDMLDAFWRAIAYCLHPRVMALSLLPLLIAVGLVFGLAWLYWEAALDGVQATLRNWSLMEAALQWVERSTGTALRQFLAPLLVVALSLPLVVLLSLLLVALLMSPAMVSLVARRRFAQLEQRRGAGLWLSAAYSLGCTLLALLATVISLPFWLIPPLVLLLPPLIWGWLTYKVMSFDALASHADSTERRMLMQRHHWPLLGMGLVAGYLGAAPSLLWAFSAAALVAAPLLIPLSIWLYTLVFAFSSLWFTHYCLGALARLRAEAAAAAAPKPDRVIELPALPVPAAPPALPGA